VWRNTGAGLKKYAHTRKRCRNPIPGKKFRVVFVNSMSNLLHPDVPFKFIKGVFRRRTLTRTCPLIISSFSISSFNKEIKLKHLHDLPG